MKKQYDNPDHEMNNKNSVGDELKTGSQLNLH